MRRLRLRAEASCRHLPLEPAGTDSRKLASVSTRIGWGGELRSRGRWAERGCAHWPPHAQWAALGIAGVWIGSIREWRIRARITPLGASIG